ncbi:hypothetical protein JAAARDRAFT_163286 [Jaapia argillacea MUCL 33604]|uniref:DUF7330 domain-containing protein n=1 Tax=Jaapia argillacea MUCL 33604 TaxID=933084 RepID=A0A067PDH2_9AGAM|nr:hypothetical protein JAAARDRAFT_163286 [Jaapia argillacea MUCL 33604]
MIITDKDSKAGFQEVVEEQGPPPYSSAAEASPSAGPSTPPPYPADAKPTNYLCITRTTTSVKGTYVIDPVLIVPDAILPKLSPGEVRKNLKLGSTTGSVSADVYLCPGAAAPLCGTAEECDMLKKRRATLETYSVTGSVNVKVRAPSATPFHLTCKTETGSVRVRLPRSFRGPLSAKSNTGSISFSSALEPYVTTFSEVNGKRFCFIGNVEETGWAHAPDSWVGDEVHAETSTGSIKFSFADEDELSGSSGGSGGSWFSRIFGGGRSGDRTPTNGVAGSVGGTQVR